VHVADWEQEPVGLRVLPERVKRLGVRELLGGLGLGVGVAVTVKIFDLVGGLAVWLAVALNVLVGLGDRV